MQDNNTTEDKDRTYKRMDNNKYEEETLFEFPPKELRFDYPTW